MYLNQHQMEHLLRPEDYTSVGFFDREMENLLKPAWHLVASRGQVRAPGSFLTFDLLGVPLIIYNFSGELRAFINVCSHRHCEISSKPEGSMPGLKCQYHGWEYKEDGHTARIPDAGCFRPFDREMAKLKGVRIDFCGELIFATFDETAPALRQFLGDTFDDMADRFGGLSRYQQTFDLECNANWKVPVENTLEAYHILEVHPSLLSKMQPGESFTEHTLRPEFTSLTYDLREHWLTYRLLRRGVKILGGELTNRYTHVHIHPSFVFVKLDLHAYAFSYLPVSHSKTRIRAIAYSFRGKRKNPIAWITWQISKFFGKRIMTTIVKEDAMIFEKQQKGLIHSPHKGCLGTMEERIHAFQKYVLKGCPHDTSS